MSSSPSHNTEHMALLKKTEAIPLETMLADPPIPEPVSAPPEVMSCAPISYTKQQAGSILPQVAYQHVHVSFPPFDPELNSSLSHIITTLSQSPDGPEPSPSRLHTSLPHAPPLQVGEPPTPGYITLPSLRDFGQARVVINGMSELYKLCKK